MFVKKAIVTGATGQDGVHLASVLCDRGVDVVGMFRPRTGLMDTFASMDHLMSEPRFRLEPGDVTDQGSMVRLIDREQPDAIFNLAAQSFVGSSWDTPHMTANVVGIGALNVLEAVREVDRHVRVYQASSSEMFGGSSGPLTEDSPMHPRSPYGVAKLFAHRMAVNYRESFDMHVSCGILFNHESERRGPQFVTQKIATQVVEVFMGARDVLALGNIEARRDWGHAGDYVEAMIRMVEAGDPDDYVVATGEAHSVRDFLWHAVRIVCEWAKIGAEQTGAVLDQLHEDGRIVWDDDEHMRPADIGCLIGDATKIQRKLGWRPTVPFTGLVRRMVEHQIVTQRLDPEAAFAAVKL